MRSKTIGERLVVLGILATVAAASRAVSTTATEPVTRERPAETQGGSPWIRTLPGGVKVELVGVSSHPAAAETWWSPDGSPLPRAPYVRSGGTVHRGLEHQAREIAVRVGNESDKDPTHRWEVIPSDSSGSGSTPIDRDGHEVPDLEIISVTMPRDRTSCKVRLGVAAGNWAVQATGEPRSGSAHGMGKLSIIFARARETEGKTAIAVSHNERDNATRVVAIDREGSIHTPRHARSFGAGPIQQWDNE